MMSLNLSVILAAASSRFFAVFLVQIYRFDNQLHPLRRQRFDEISSVALLALPIQLAPIIEHPQWLALFLVVQREHPAGLAKQYIDMINKLHNRAK